MGQIRHPDTTVISGSETSIRVNLFFLNHKILRALEHDAVLTTLVSTEGEKQCTSSSSSSSSSSSAFPWYWHLVKFGVRWPF